MVRILVSVRVIISYSAFLTFNLRRFQAELDHISYGFLIWERMAPIKTNKLGMEQKLWVNPQAYFSLTNETSQINIQGLKLPS
jgi:hypothetical protein